MYFSFNETSYSCNYFILDHTVIHNTKKSLFLLSNNLHFATHLKKKTNPKTLHCRQQKRQLDLSQLMAETLSGMRICTESKISQMCEQAQGHRKGDV